MNMLYNIFMEVIILNERLKLIRAHLGKTQKEFGSSLGVSRDTYASYESGRVIPNATFIQLLCSTYNVNKTWLELGEGEMFLSSSENIIDILIKEYDLDDVDASIIQGYLSLPASQRSAVKSYITNIISNIVSSSGADKPPSETPNRDDLIIQRIADTDKKLLDLMTKNKSNASDG